MSMKSYLRFIPDKIIGSITSTNCNIAFDWSGNLAFTGSCQEINVFNIRLGTLICSIKVDISPLYPYDFKSNGCGEVVFLESSSDKLTLAAGYSTGEIRIIDYSKYKIIETFRGHSSGISTLAFNASGTLLVSGGRDCDIILWDMVASRGISKFRGHKEQITGILFLEDHSHSKGLLVSSSKDSLLKVWDITTCSCIQTVVGHRCEILCLTSLLCHLDKNQNQNQIDPTQLVITGSSDEYLRGYVVRKDTPSPLNLEDKDSLEYIGCIKRDAGAVDRCQSLAVNSSTTVLAAQSNGKVVDLFKIRSRAEISKKMKRKLKRSREKNSKHDIDTGNNNEITEEEAAEAAAAKDSFSVTLSDIIEPHSFIRSHSRIKSIAINKKKSSTDDERVLVSLSNNSIEIYKLNEEFTAEKTIAIDYQGHRSDVRSVTISTNGTLIATCSNDSVKVWSTKSYSCVSTCYFESNTDEYYPLCILFVPGNKYLIVGMKSGDLVTIDTNSGAIIPRENHEYEKWKHTAAVWSITLHPDEKGFMSASGDKWVKFWNFSLNKKSFDIVLSRQLEMSHDCLCATYSTVKDSSKTFLAVGLLDNTVKVFYEDSLKFFLSLYGHKLPVTALSISYDNTLLISGSADKCIKIWGLDFGDCHRSLLGHEDSITFLKFQMNTHYFFSSSKDGQVKYWDADRFELIQSLPGHLLGSSVWGLDISNDGSFCVSCGQDRSLRFWSRGEDLLFIEEEKDREFESQLNTASVSASNSIVFASPETLVSSAHSEVVKEGERLIESILLVDTELKELAEFERNEKNIQNNKKYTFNKLLLGMHPLKYLLRQLKSIKTPDLENSLLVLPFNLVCTFIPLLIKMSSKMLDIELCTRCAIFLFHSHRARLMNSKILINEIQELQSIIRDLVGNYRNLIGVNMSGLKYTKSLNKIN